MPAKPKFFAAPDDWRAWLEEHHANTEELWVGFYKRDSGRVSITWPEAVDGALCFGWIDGIRKSIDAVSYKIRFTPRKLRSVWSAVNIKRATKLNELGQMHPAGMAVFEKRTGSRSQIYSYEQRIAATLPRQYARLFRKQPAAWDFFRAQPSWYRRTAIWWVISAKKEETRLKRLSTLIECCQGKRYIKAVPRTPKEK
ncbi:MAG TPA: YdeI/OmpD-associated family protein [Candidatus Sulfotelmatobacter sp.]|nr:YdeI/OmpD-associated family protein [Candidatus Sulfotelmatobacter sp.]